MVISEKQDITQSQICEDILRLLYARCDSNKQQMEVLFDVTSLVFSAVLAIDPTIDKKERQSYLSNLLDVFSGTCFRRMELYDLLAHNNDVS